MRNSEGVQAHDGEEERVALLGGLSSSLLDESLPLGKGTEVVPDLCARPDQL